MGTYVFGADNEVASALTDTYDPLLFSQIYILTALALVFVVLALVLMVLAY